METACMGQGLELWDSLCASGESTPLTFTSPPPPHYSFEGLGFQPFPAGRWLLILKHCDKAPQAATMALERPQSLLPFPCGGKNLPRHKAEDRD